MGNEYRPKCGDALRLVPVRSQDKSGALRQEGHPA